MTSAEKDDDLCVFCGGSNHPGTCGYPIEDAPFPWLGVAIFLVLPVIIDVVRIML